MSVGVGWGELQAEEAVGEENKGGGCCQSECGLVSSDCHSIWARCCVMFCLAPSVDITACFVSVICGAWLSWMISFTKGLNRIATEIYMKVKSMPPLI